MTIYQAYGEYKDSGVEWLGDVPAHWSVKKLKHLVRLVTAKSIDKENPIALEHIQSWTGKLISKNSEFAGDGIKFIAGDILFGKLRPYLAKVYLAKENGEAIGDFHVMRPIDNAYGRFLRSLMLTTDYISTVNASTYGAKMPRVSWDFTANIQLPLCSSGEAIQIANFLDHETAKIDTLIAKQEQLIALLKEKRQAVIAHAVTKGLNPDAPMKDSGVEWLGEVPAHWLVCKLKWKAQTTSGSTPSTSKHEMYYNGGDIPWIRTTDLNNGKLEVTPINITPKALQDTACSILPIGSILVAMYGGAGSIGKHSLLMFEATINQAVCAIYPSNSFQPDYLHYLYEFYRPFWMINAAGTRKDPNIGQDHIREAKIILPPKEEQEKIVLYVDKTLFLLNKLKNKAINAIALAKERKTALISAAVTGKIDVRAWQAPAGDCTTAQQAIRRD